LHLGLLDAVEQAIQAAPQGQAGVKAGLGQAQLGRRQAGGRRELVGQARAALKERKAQADGRVPIAVLAQPVSPAPAGGGAGAQAGPPGSPGATLLLQGAVQAGLGLAQAGQARQGLGRHVFARSRGHRQVARRLQTFGLSTPQQLGQVQGGGAARALGPAGLPGGLGRQCLGLQQRALILAAGFVAQLHQVDVVLAPRRDGQRLRFGYLRLQKAQKGGPQRVADLGAHALPGRIGGLQRRAGLGPSRHVGEAVEEVEGGVQAGAAAIASVAEAAQAVAGFVVAALAEGRRSAGLGQKSRQAAAEADLGLAVALFGIAQVAVGAAGFGQGLLPAESLSRQRRRQQRQGPDE
jgi:hypothetical protein